MELYQGILESTGRLLEPLPKRRFPYAPADAWEDVGHSELVLGRDAAFELGGGGKPSVQYACITSEQAAIENEVVLIGPDLNELRGDAPFARIAVLATVPLTAASGKEGESQLFRTIRSMEFVKYHVYPKGYMVRIASGSYREQVRIDRKALKHGMRFQQIGCSYIRRYLENPFIRHVRMIFITDPNAPFDALVKNAKQSDDVTHALDHMQDGISMDCSSCHLKPVCDEVEGLRELHFGIQKERERIQ